MSPKGPLQCKRCQRFGHTQRYCGYAPRCVACGGTHLTCGCPIPREQPQCCGCECNHTTYYRVCVKWIRRRRLLKNKWPIAAERASLQAMLPHRKLSKIVPLPSSWNWAIDGNTSSEEGVSPRPPLHPPTPILIPLLSRSQRFLSSLHGSQPGRRPGLKIPRPYPQQPLNEVLGSQRERLPRVPKPPHPKPQHQTWRSPPKIPPPHLRNL